MSALKLSFNGEVRRAKMSFTPLGSKSVKTYSSLVETATHLFPGIDASNGQLVFRWTDEDNDQISCSSDLEVTEALRCMSAKGDTIKFSMTLTSKLSGLRTDSNALTPFSELGVHRGVTCDGCGMFPMRGDRFKCSARKDFDLCESCESSQPQPYPMIKIYAPSRKIESTPSLASVPSVHHGVTCDGCGMFPIRGDRFKCSVRKNFDLCSGCEASQLQPYPMIKIYAPSQKIAFIFVALENEEEGHEQLGGPGSHPFWRRFWNFGRGGHNKRGHCHPYCHPHHARWGDHRFDGASSDCCQPHPHPRPHPHAGDGLGWRPRRFHRAHPRALGMQPCDIPARAPLTESEDIDMALLGEAIRLSQENEHEAVGSTSTPTATAKSTNFPAKSVDEVYASGGVSRRAAVNACAASETSMSNVVVAEDVDENDDEYIMLLEKAASSSSVPVYPYASASVGHQGEEASQLHQSQYSFIPDPTPHHVVAAEIHPSSLLSSTPANPPKSPPPSHNSPSLNGDEAMWAHVWARELEVLASMGFTANLPELVALLKANVAEGPASLSPSLNGSPSVRGMHRVLDLLL